MAYKERIYQNRYQIDPDYCRAVVRWIREQSS